jgi:predicted metal-binding membrane protein
MGALRMGTKNGGWCVGCCWALMASLFALGIMSITWMAVVAGLIAVEKTMPWRPVASLGTAAVLLVLGSLVLVAPDVVPGLTIPHAGMHDMSGMGN